MDALRVLNEKQALFEWFQKVPKHVVDLLKDFLVDLD